MSVIESADYEQTRQRLMHDPIVIAMAEEIKDAPASIKASMVHNDDPSDPLPTPTFQFMMQANDEYRSRGGKDAHHIGGVAEAILRLVNG